MMPAVTMPAPGPQAPMSYMPQWWMPDPGFLVRQGIDPFLYGQPGFSPLTMAGLDAFQQGTQQIVQQQAQLQGLGRSPAVGEMTADALAQVLPQFIMADYDNRLKAAGILQGEEQLTQSAANLASQISNQEMMRQLEAFKTSGELMTGAGSLFAGLGQDQLAQMQLALQAAGAGGQLQQDVSQGALDAAQQERLRQQGLSEAGTTGLFNTALPPLPQTSGKTSGGGK